jgi:hypothetical protein
MAESITGAFCHLDIFGSAEMFLGEATVTEQA